MLGIELYQEKKKKKNWISTGLYHELSILFTK